MPCLAAPKLPYPSAELSLLLPDLDFSPPDLSAELCCRVETPPIPGTPIIVPLGALGIPGVAVVVSTAMTVIIEAIDDLNKLLDGISVDCPFD